MYNADELMRSRSHTLLHDVGLELAISQLPAELRWVAILSVVEGLSAQAIADLAGVSLETVNDVLKRGQVLTEQIHRRLTAQTSQGGMYGNH